MFRATAMGFAKRSTCFCRHCEERSDEAIHSFFVLRKWIASLTLAMTEAERADFAPSGKTPKILSIPFCKNILIYRKPKTGPYS
jgi:hypothetical protein